MIRNHTSKYILAALWTSVILLTQSLQGRPKITTVENRANNPVEVAEPGATHAFDGHMSKKLKVPLFIPFVSIDNYRDEFIAGEPYFPAEALIISTTEGRYAIWRDETGIVSAREYVPGLMREECVPVTLFKPQAGASAHSILWSLVLLLSINTQGKVHLYEQKV